MSERGGRMMRSIGQPRTHRALLRGFSLFEVLLALALIIALGAVMFGFLNNLLSARQRVIEATAQHRAVTALFERLEHDLAFTLVSGPDQSAGIKGDATSLRLFSRGHALQPLTDGDLSAAFRDLQRTILEFDPAARRLAIGREVVRPAPGTNAGDDVRNAEVEESVAPSSDDETLEPEELDGPVWRVRFRYHDGNGWHNSYDSAASGRLPVAVEVAIWLRPWPGESWEDEEEPLIDESLNRLTFDAEPVFDDQAWGERPDRDFGAEPRPDRMRVIPVPDARGED